MEGRDQNALVAAIKIEENRYGPSALREMATRLKSDSGSPLPWFELASIATNPDLISGPENIENFLAGNSTAYGLLYDSGSFELAEWYQSMLREAARNSGRDWQIIQGDPTALLVWTALGRSHPDLWSYFIAESEWLSDTLLFVAPNDLPETANPEQRLAWIPETVAGLKKYHPLGREIYLEAVADSENAPMEELEDIFSETALLIAGLLKYGDIVHYTSVKNNLPVAEVLELLVVNPDMFEPPEHRAQRDDWAVKQAARLIQIQKNRPNVWGAAHMKPLVLKLDAIVPDLSESLISKYGADDVATFLFDNFEEIDIAKAAAAVDKFGDLAIYIFQKYGWDPNLSILLRTHGPRIVPFLAVYGDSQGVERLTSEKGQGWLNKYFDEEGNERDKGWIAAVPLIGGPTEIIKNVAQGHPSTWGELGWAALDVVDGALLVASLGATAPVTAGKQSVKTGIKTTVRGVTKKEVRRIRM